MTTSQQAPKLDLVLYGATGFTGRLAAKYVERQYGRSIKWALAGRSESKLRQMQSELADIPQIIVADGGDEAALEALASRTAVVATCAGPFGRYGSKLVAACAKAGTDYCDITGESDWVREMINAHDAAAKQSGARIVHFCGHDSIPWDLSVLMLSKKLAEREDELVSVDFFDDINGNISGGTLETMFADEGTQRTWAFDPLLRKIDGSKSQQKFKPDNVSLLRLERWSDFTVRTSFFMADINADVVKRSNALLGYGDLTYSEGLGFKGIGSALIYMLTMGSINLALALPPVRWLLRKTVLPKPGEGPSEEAMLQGYLRVHGKARGVRGTTVSSKMTFQVDPGYMDTARMLVEAALALSLDKAKLAGVPGGSYTPAACQGTVLLDRLCATGTTFDITLE